MTSQKDKDTKALTLTSDNYHVWKLIHKVILDSKDLWQYVDPHDQGVQGHAQGSARARAQAPRPKAQAGGKKEEDKDDEIELEEDSQFEAALAMSTATLGKKAHTHIIKHVEATILYDVIAEDQTARDLWKALETKFQDGDLSNMLMLDRELTNINMAEGGDLDTYLAKAKLIARKLGAIGHPVKPEQLIARILNGLPRTWDPLVMTMNTGMKLADIEAKLKHEDLRRKCKGKASAMASERERTQPSERALAAAIVAQEEKKERGGGGETRKCYNCETIGHIAAECKAPCGYCNIKGHVSRDCRKKKDTKHAARKRTRAAAAAVESDDTSDSDDDDDVALAIEIDLLEKKLALAKSQRRK